MFKFQVFVELLRPLLLIKEESLGPLWGFFFCFIHIYLYIYTHEYTPKHLRNYTCTGLILGQPDVMFVFLLVMFVFAGLSFCSRRRREIKLPLKEAEKSQMSGLPKTFLYLKGRETESAGRSLLLMRLLKKK